MATGATPRFMDEMFLELWTAADTHGLDPVGVVAQAGKETGWGAYPGNVKPWFFNTAGIKVSSPDEVRRIIAAERFGIPVSAVNMAQLNAVSQDHPLCHSQMVDFVHGAEIQVLHLLEWCGFPAAWSEHFDPRSKAVRTLLPSKGPAVTWADLGGRWTTSATYGTEIEEIMRRLSVPVPL